MLHFNENELLKYRLYVGSFLLYPVYDRHSINYNFYDKVSQILGSQIMIFIKR